MQNEDYNGEDIIVDAFEITADPRDTVEKHTAKRFVDLVQSGLKPGIAAKKMQTTLRKIQGSEETKKEITKLLKSFGIAAEVRKEIAKAALNKLLIEALDSEDIDDRKLVFSVAKEIGVQEGGPTEGGPSVVINLGEELKGIITGIQIEGITDNASTENKEEDSN
jgi:hypothetical protein